MLIMTRPLIALGFASAIFLGTASPTLAGTAHARAQTQDVTTPWQGEGYRAYGQIPQIRVVPRQYRNEHEQFTPPNRSEQTWDSYGLRWDGGN